MCIELIRSGRILVLQAWPEARRPARLVPSAPILRLKRHPAQTKDPARHRPRLLLKNLEGSTKAAAVMRSIVATPRTDANRAEPQVARNLAHGSFTPLTWIKPRGSICINDYSSPLARPQATVR